MKMNPEKDTANLKKIAEYLTKAQIEYEFIEIPLGKDAIMPAILTNYSHKGYTFDVLILHSNDWIMVQCMFLDLEDIPEVAIPMVYELCLTLNFELLETTFSLHNRQMYIEADMPISVSYDDFIHVELSSIAKGIDTFMDTLGIEGVEVKGTKGTIRLK